MIDGAVEHLLVGRWSVVGGSVEHLLVNQWSVGRWRTCWWVGGRLPVVGGLSLIGGFVIRLGLWYIYVYY